MRIGVNIEPEALTEQGGWGEVTLICILIIISQALHPNRQTPQVLSTGPEACPGMRSRSLETKGVLFFPALESESESNRFKCRSRSRIGLNAGVGSRSLISLGVGVK